jgi:hypothetical protein
VVAALEDRCTHRFAPLSMGDGREPMLEAIQQRMGAAEFWSLKPAILSVDAGSVRVRRRLARMIAAEQAVPVAI